MGCEDHPVRSLEVRASGERGPRNLFVHLLMLLRDDSRFNSRILARILSFVFPVLTWPFFSISNFLALDIDFSTENKGVSWMRVQFSPVSRVLVCGMEKVAVASARILASDRVEKDSVFL